jgi:hypothetical protein
MKVERDAVHAVALAGGLGAIVEHVTEMAAAAAAIGADLSVTHRARFPVASRR